jgi:Peptidase family C25
VPVFITSASGLQSVYGADGYKAVLRSLNALIQSRTGSSLRVLDDPASMQGAQVAGGLDAVSMRSALQSCYTGSAAPEAVVIVGDQRVVPAFSVPNPVTDRTIDPDPSVFTDNLYGYFTATQPANCLNPDVPVGRIAGGVDGAGQDFCNLLSWQMTLWNQAPLRSGYVEVASRQWQDASSFVLSSVGTARVFISPDSLLNASSASNLDCRFLYCNLHGFPNQAAWMGYDPGLGYPVTAVTPDAFQPQYISGAVVFTEACYGLFTAGKATNASCALSLLASGAAAVIGSTGLAFGTAWIKPQSVIDADALAQGFFNTALQSPISVGACLKAAKVKLLQAGSPDPYITKTLLAFQLLGDPTYVIL